MAYDSVARLDGLLAKIETTYGTDPVPVVGTDGVRVGRRLLSGFRYNARWPNTREGVANNLVWPAKPAVPRGRTVGLDIAWEMKGAGSDVVCEADPLFRACGWAVVDGSSIFTYTLAASAHESCTIYAYAGRKLWKVAGCRGWLEWPWGPGILGTVIFHMEGRLSAEPVDSAVGTITSYDTTTPLAAVNTALKLDASITPVVMAGSGFNQGCTPEWTEDANGADGLGEFDWAEAQPFFTLVARKIAAATYDPWADELARTTRAISGTWGSVQFNKLQLNLPETYVMAPDFGMSQGFTDYTLRFNVAGDSAAPTIVSL